MPVSAPIIERRRLGVVWTTTIETPAYLIEPSSKFVHDEGMEQLAHLQVDALLDPAVLMPAIAVNAALVSGLAARMVEVCEDHLPRRRSD